MATSIFLFVIFPSLSPSLVHLDKALDSELKEKGRTSSLPPSLPPSLSPSLLTNGQVMDLDKALVCKLKKQTGLAHT